MKYEAENRVCEVCGSDQYRPLWTKKAWSQAILLKHDNELFHDRDVICMKCGLGYKNPMLTEESLKDFYNGTYAQTYKSAQQKGIPKGEIVDGIMRAIYTFEFMKKAGISVQGKKGFEIGVGMGTLFKGVQSLGADMHGIDTDARSCEIADKIYSVKADQVNFLDFQTDEKYDILFICNTLEHFYSPRKVLTKIKDMLTDDGILIVEIPSYKFPFMHCIVDAFFSSAHNYTFSFDSFFSLARQCGYGLKEFGYVGHHTSMLFALCKGVFRDAPIDTIDYDNILARLDEQDAVRGIASEISKELFNNTDVSNIIQRVLSELPYTSNQAFFAFVPSLIEAGRNQQVISFMEQYRTGQSEDINSCRGTALHYTGLAHRQMGDFLEAKKYLKAAKESYPRFEDYNFIEDLKLDGIVSDEGFAQYVWWNNEKMLEDLG